MEIRDYKPKQDDSALIRIFKEVGWLEDNKEHEKAFISFFTENNIKVAASHDVPECAVFSAPGTMHHSGIDLSLCAITAVVTSRIVRKQGFAKHTLAHVLGKAGSDGIAVANLGIFDQGYYEKHGFGTGNYERWQNFSPSALQLPIRNDSLPVRLTVKDAKEVHANRLTSIKFHGDCMLTPVHMSKIEMDLGKNGFGLGFRDKNGILTHHMWIVTENPEHGPYTVYWSAYQSKLQLLELLELINRLSDQIESISMHEPPGIHLQDFIKRPFHMQRITEGGKYTNNSRTSAYWQARILNIQPCIKALKLPSLSDNQHISFNLELEDPLESLLTEAGASPASTGYSGCAGSYIVSLGPESHIRPGTKKGLPTLRSSINSFTRLWLGVLPASSLSAAALIDISPELEADLDEHITLPEPKRLWDF